MKYPESLARLPWITARNASGGRWRLDLAGTQGWCWQWPQGLCIAVMVAPETAADTWWRKASLMLAAAAHALDDALLLEEGKPWLVRRYPGDMGAVELEASLNQQLSVARFLSLQGDAAQGTTTVSTNVTKAMGRWA